MIPDKKKIAVFIPCYNAATTIEATLKSVEEAIENLGFRIPVYLYDDCSKDDSVGIATVFRRDPGSLIISRNESNSGERKTTNDAFSFFYGKYDWIFIIHADDIVKPDWLSEIYRQIREADKERIFTVWSSFDSLDDATGRVDAGDDTGLVSLRERSLAEKKYYITKLYGNWHISGAAINVALFQQLGGFDISMAQFGDTDFFTRGLLAGFNDIYISRTLTFYRTVTNSVTSTSIRTNRDIREILYIAKKFRSVLDVRELRLLYKNLTCLSLRRSGRWFLKADRRNFFFCVKVTFYSATKYFRFSF